MIACHSVDHVLWSALDATSLTSTRISAWYELNLQLFATIVHQTGKTEERQYTTTLVSFRGKIYLHHPYA